MEKTIVTGYINNFRRIFSKYLKDNVGIRNVIYPFPQGTLLVFEFGYNLSSKDESRGDAESITNACHRAGIPEELWIHELKPSSQVVLWGNKVAIIKGNMDSLWNTESASKDVHLIMTKLRS